MPFVQRVVEPKYLSRTSLRNEDGECLIKDEELEAVTNNTLSNALRQLASLVLIANDIFTELTSQLNQVGERSRSLQDRIVRVEAEVSKYDPKQVPVPESDICTFALRREHFHARQLEATGLFTASSRPSAVQALYDAAARTPVHAMRQLDRWRRDGHRSSRFFLCTPVLGKRRRIGNRIDVEIETRLPAAVEELRRWTSTEALGDVTVTPDCLSRITSNISGEPGSDGDVTDGTLSGDEGPIDHKLPSPEEQVQAVALKFPAEVIAVDVSGRRFDRMCHLRKSLLHVEIPEVGSGHGDSNTVKRRSRPRKPRGKRRNTITGTDQKEIHEAIIGDPHNGEASSSLSPDSPDSGAVTRSQSSDLLKKSSPPDGKRSHFSTLKNWGKNRFKLMNRSAEPKNDTRVSDVDDVNIYETVTMRRRRNVDKGERKVSHERKPSYSSSEKSMSIPTPTPPVGTTSHMSAVKFRESSAQRRQRRTGGNKDEPHSSSGNWSASSESGRASIGSEITTTTHPRSTPTATSSNSLNHHAPGSVASRRRFLNTSASSSVTSEGTLTPDIIHDLHDDGETSSVYSCDTEGYYTSFHLDSGLKTLKEEEIGLPISPLHSTTAFTNSSGNQTVLTAENEYELFGKGSTSTTTSSAGTVCTTLMAAGSDRSLVIGPAVPERKSSLTKLDRSHSGSSSNNLERSYSSSTVGSTLERTGTIKRNGVLLKKETVVAMVHGSNKTAGAGAESPDSGHNTSSSPIESVSSPNGNRSCSEFEFSESSDLEGVDRIERIRYKTTINSSRIPSMCVITPPQSDDDSVKSVKCTISTNNKNSNYSTTNETQRTNDLGERKVSRPKLDLPILPTHETDLDTITFNDSLKNNPDKNCDSTITKKQTAASQKVLVTNIPSSTEYASVQTSETPKFGLKLTDPKPLHSFRKSPLLPLNNMLGKLRGVLPTLKKSPTKETLPPMPDPVYDSAGDYVTIADVRNNNEKPSHSNGVYYSNDVVKRNLATVLSGKLRETEYVSLNELPCNVRDMNPIDSSAACADSLERKQKGARVTLDAEGKVVYSSDSLPRRKGAHTTFEPGPFVKDVVATPTPSPLPSHRTPKTIRPISTADSVTSNLNRNMSPASVMTRPLSPLKDSRPLSPQLGKVIIRAPSANSAGSTPTADFVRMPPTTIVTPGGRPMSPRARGAYVNMQDAQGAQITPTRDEECPRSPSRKHEPADSNLNRMQNTHSQQTKFSTFNQRSSAASQNSPVSSFQRNNTAYWTLQARKPIKKEITERSVTPDITRGHQQPQQMSENKIDNNKFSYSTPSKIETNNHKTKVPMGISNFFSPIKKTEIAEKRDLLLDANTTSNSLKISPIDPRNTGGFQSSTPSKPEDNINKKIATNIASTLLSPKKSTMSNEELYAVIHKSKKKMNIKVSDTERCASPALSVVSSSSSGRSSPKIDHKLIEQSRTRHSWAPTENQIVLPDENALQSSNEAGARQSWACSDRLGPAPRMSRLDFKKLLLQHGTRSNIVPSTSNKLSAVEQLKLAKEKQEAKPSGNVSILDLSGSPKTFSNRRIINRQSQGGLGSPKHTANKDRNVSKIISPRSTWRFASPRSDVLSSTIQEVISEEESPNNSVERNKNKSNPDVINSAQNIKAEPTIRQSNVNEFSVQNKIQESNKYIDEKTLKMKDNIFLQTEENNFMKCERTSFNVKPIQQMINYGMTRSQFIQAQRAQFLNQQPPSNQIAAQFKNGHYTGISSSTNAVPEHPQPCPSPPTLETAL